MKIYHDSTIYISKLSPKHMFNRNNMAGIGVFFGGIIDIAEKYGDKINYIEIDKRDFINSVGEISSEISELKLVKFFMDLWRINKEDTYYLISDWIDDIEEVEDIDREKIIEFVKKIGKEKVRNFQTEIANIYGVELFVKMWNRHFPEICGTFDKKENVYLVINTDYKVHRYSKTACCNKKYSGLLEAPPRAVEDIYNWCIGCYYAQKIYSMEIELDDYEYRLERERKKESPSEYALNSYQKDVDFYIEKLKELRSEAKQYPKIKPRKIKSVRKKIVIDKTGWRYNKIIQKADKKKIEHADSLFGIITVVLKFGHLSGSAQGKFNAGKAILSLEFDERELRQTIEHELKHWSQHYIGILAKGFGMPSKKMQNKYLHQRGVSRILDKQKRDDIIKRLQDEGVTREDYHSLDDREFYTDLDDIVKEYAGVKKLKGKDKNLMIRWIVGMSSPEEFDADKLKEIVSKSGIPVYMMPAKFFRSLKKHSRLKWKKAIREFVKNI